jgi:hypothetical protein
MPAVRHPFYRGASRILTREDRDRRGLFPLRAPPSVARPGRGARERGFMATGGQESVLAPRQRACGR